MPGYDRRDFLRISAAAAGAGGLAAGCSGATLGDDDRGAAEGPVKVGLLLPESGVFKALADDQRAGWNLYLKQSGGLLGGRDVRVVTADEGDGQKTETARSAVERLLERERCQVVCGIISSANLIAVQPMFSEARVPLLCTNAGAVQVLGKKYVWRSSFVNGQAGRALGAHVAESAGGPVAAIAWDYAAGHDFVNGFLKTFEPAGGELAGDPIFTPFPMGGTSFQPYLQQIEKRNPKAVYAFFAGADAVKFVKEYEKFGLADKYQLYAPGDLTEGGVLAAQEGAAEGIRTAMHYAPDLDNEANRRFVANYQKQRDRPPTIFSVAAYDAGWILDRAIAAGADLSSETLDRAIGELGEIDSPRGPWTFGKNRSPVQKFYLREVRRRGDVLSNVVLDELVTLDDSA